MPTIRKYHPIVVVDIRSHALGKESGLQARRPVGLRLVLALANHVTVLVLKHELRSRVCATAQGQWHTVNLGVHDRDPTDEVRVCSLGAKSVALALQFLPQDGVTSDDNRPVLTEADRVLNNCLHWILPE